MFQLQQVWTHGKRMLIKEKRKRNKERCFKYNTEGHIAKDCKGTQLMKKQKVQKESDNKDNKEKE